MNYKHRYHKIKELFKAANRTRRNQKAKIDIVCRGLVDAQREFIYRLNEMAFAAFFFEKIVGITQLDELRNSIISILRSEIGSLDAAIFIRKHNYFNQIILGDCQVGISEQLFKSVPDETADAVCRSNRVCTLNELTGMGLEYDPVKLGSLSGFTIPMQKGFSSAGFLFIIAPNGQLQSKDADLLEQLGKGLLKAVESCSLVRV